MRHLLGLPACALRAAARALLLALSVATLGPLVHGAHPEECDPQVVLHDESDHHVQAAAPEDRAHEEGEHCGACHFARSPRGTAAWQQTGLSAPSEGLLLAHADGQLVRISAAAPLPARAPPA